MTQRLQIWCNHLLNVFYTCSSVKWPGEFVAICCCPQGTKATYIRQLLMTQLNLRQSVRSKSHQQLLLNSACQLLLAKMNLSPRISTTSTVCKLWGVNLQFKTLTYLACHNRPQFLTYQGQIPCVVFLRGTTGFVLVCAQQKWLLHPISPPLLHLSCLKSHINTNENDVTNAKDTVTSNIHQLHKVPTYKLYIKVLFNQRHIWQTLDPLSLSSTSYFHSHLLPSASFILSIAIW